MKKILNILAFNQLGALVLANEAIRSEQYHCPLCKKELVLKRGKIVRAHYAHKTNTSNCTAESLLHYSFKVLLFNKIQKHIDENAELPVSWNCEWCDLNHKGNLLKRVKVVKMEHSFGICRPDICLFDGKGQSVAAIEVVVTHSPEMTTLNFYKENNIRLIEIKLTTDEDISRINEDFLALGSQDLCTNEKCRKCIKPFRQLSHKMFYKNNCYRCNNENINMVGPLQHNDVDIAREYGSNIEWVKTHGFYANVCKKCHAFVGESYNRWVDAIYLPCMEVATHWYCPNCRIRVPLKERIIDLHPGYCNFNSKP